MNATRDMLVNSKKSHLITRIVIVSIGVSVLSLVFDLVTFVVRKYIFNHNLHQNVDFFSSWTYAESGGCIFLSILIANVITYPFLFKLTVGYHHQQRLGVVAAIYTTSIYLRIVLCIILFQVLETVK